MKWTAAFLAAIVIAMPLGFASADTGTNTGAVSSFGLKLKQFGQAFGDFAFRIRSALTFDEKSKISLIQDRNAEMKARQQEWLGIKAAAMEQIKSGNLTADEKKNIIETLQAEHTSIIKEHLSLTGDLREIQLKAKEKRMEKLEKDAENESESEEHSNLSTGLGLGGRGVISLGSNLTADQAESIVQHSLGFDVTSVTTDTSSGSTVYVVAGSQTKTAGLYELTRGFTVQIDAATGVVMSVGMNANISATANATTMATARASSNGRASSSIETDSDSAEVHGNAEVHGDSQTHLAVGGLTVG